MYWGSGAQRGDCVRTQLVSGQLQGRQRTEPAGTLSLEAGLQNHEKILSQHAVFHYGSPSRRMHRFSCTWFSTGCWTPLLSSPATTFKWTCSQGNSLLLVCIQLSAHLLKTQARGKKAQGPVPRRTLPSQLPSSRPPLPLGEVLAGLGLSPHFWITLPIPETHNSLPGLHGSLPGAVLNAGLTYRDAEPCTWVVVGVGGESISRGCGHAGCSLLISDTGQGWEGKGGGDKLSLSHSLPG